jgi:hypothetical protein
MQIAALHPQLKSPRKELERAMGRDRHWSGGAAHEALRSQPADVFKQQPTQLPAKELVMFRPATRRDDVYADADRKFAAGNDAQQAPKK